MTANTKYDRQPAGLAPVYGSARRREDRYAAWQKAIAAGLKIEDLNGLAKVELHEDGWWRGFQRYDSYQRADMMSSHRLGHRQKERMGEAFWTHLAVPGLCFPTRKRALDAAARALGLNVRPLAPADNQTPDANDTP